ARWKHECFRVTHCPPMFNPRPARIPEPKQLPALTDPCPGGVIERCAKTFVIGNAPHVDEKTVPATHDQSNVRLDFFAAKKWREQMPFQMIDREKWFAGADGQTFRRRISDKQRAGKSRSAGGREGVDLIDRNVRGRHCALEQTR